MGIYRVSNGNLNQLIERPALNGFAARAANVFARDGDAHCCSLARRINDDWIADDRYLIRDILRLQNLPLRQHALQPVRQPVRGKDERFWYSPPLAGPTLPINSIDSNLIVPDMSIFGRLAS